MKTQSLYARRFPILFALGCLALSPATQAVSPPPDGGYPGGNTAEGQLALERLTTGTYNTGVGLFSLLSINEGSFCTGVGAGTLLANTADETTATGAGALLSNTTGAGNTANGAFALFSNTEGLANTAIGSSALLSNIDGDGNTAVGEGALNQSTTGTQNNAFGRGALKNNQTGSFNNGIGAFTLIENTTGWGNTAIGDHAGSALTTGNFNICIGVNVNGVAGEQRTIRIGDNLSDTQGNSACYIGGIYNQLGDPGTLTALSIDSNGKLATAASSRRFKRDIKPIADASESILRLKPVAFHYKGDAKNTPCFGLIAEEVAEVNPDLVVRNKNGEVWTVRYEQINAMLLNEFLREHAKGEEQDRKIQKQEATITQLQKDVDALVARLKEQDSKIQRVTDRIETATSTSQMAFND
jgi:Chaperone of endosialidase